MEANDERIICSDDDIRSMLDGVDIVIPWIERVSQSEMEEVTVDCAAAGVIFGGPGSGTHEKWIRVRNVIVSALTPMLYASMPCK